MTKRIKTKDRDIIKIGSSFYYRGHPPGLKRLVEKKLDAESFSEARISKEVLLETLKKTGVRQNKSNMGHLMERYLVARMNEVKAKEIRQSYYDEIERMINLHLKPFFGRFKLDSLDQPLFNKYVKLTGKVDYQNHRSIFSGFLNWCKYEGIIRWVPTFSIPKWKRKLRTVLKEDQLKLVFEHTPEDLKIYTAFALFMGLRRSEIIKLTWDRVDLDRNTLFLGEDDTKTKKEREVPLNGIVVELLKARRRTSPYVFPNKRKNGKKPHMDVSGFRRQWAKMLELTQLKFTGHDLRATWETFAHKSTNFTDTQREKMGGASIDVQKSIYVQMGADDYRGLEDVINVEGKEFLLPGAKPLLPGAKPVVSWENNWENTSRKTSKKHATTRKKTTKKK